MNHHNAFPEFCALELSTGGPDPYLKIASLAVVEAASHEQRVWRACCFVAPYEINTGALLWEHWPYPKEVSRSPDKFIHWVAENWKGFQFRRERRASRTPKKFAECLISAAEFADGESKELLHCSYEDAWRLSDKALRYFGRYALTKMLQTLYLGNGMAAGMPDIRPAGGWSPRTTLAWMYSDGEIVGASSSGDSEFVRSNRPRMIAEVNAKAETLRQYVGEYVSASGVEGELEYYDFEVLLCNYRQALTFRYPGRSHDTDLGNYHRACTYWREAFRFPLLEYRQRLFHKRVLGELNGWSGQRENLENTWKDYGYFWCDTRYNYWKSVDNLAQPTRWG